MSYIGAQEQRARAIKASALLDAIESTGVPVGPDVVRVMSDEAWVNVEKLAGTKPASAATRELVAWLAGERVRLADSDPFEGLEPQGRGA